MVKSIIKNHTLLTDYFQVERLFIAIIPLLRDENTATSNNSHNDYNMENLALGNINVKLMEEQSLVASLIHQLAIPRIPNSTTISTTNSTTGNSTTTATAMNFTNRQ